jgi:NAD(P)-dependent dehydrogenase (short-subunit alcohol dehydrogenase family)
MKIEGSKALVTGANRGIGRAIAEALLEAGAARVYTAVRRIESAGELADRYGDRVHPLHLDLEKPETIMAAASMASDVDLVVNNAGMLQVASALDSNALSSLQKEMEVNVFGLIRVAQAFAPVLKANGGGALVQLNSVASIKCFPDFATYSASKAAAYSITQGLKEKLSGQGTAVVSVHPGPIDTEMARTAGLGDMAEPPSLVADAIIKALENGAFHVFPDSMARDFWSAYHAYAEAVIESSPDSDAG